MKYTLTQQIKYRSNFSRVSVYVQANLSQITRPEDLADFPYKAVTLNPSDVDLAEWLDVINNAYSIYKEDEINLQQSKDYLENHAFLNIKDVCLFMDGARCIGAISIGTYKENPTIGGIARLAVRQEYMGQGLGKYILAYAYAQLKKAGIECGQSIIMIKRERSLMTHFKIGFYPQLIPAYKVYNNQKRFFFVRVRSYLYVKSLFRKYRMEIAEKYLC